MDKGQTRETKWRKIYEREHGNCGCRYKKIAYHSLKCNEGGFILRESTSVETSLNDNDDDNIHIIFSECCLQFLCSLLLVGASLSPA